MHRTIKITVMILLWIFVAAFVVVFDRRAARHRAETKVRALAVDIVDSLRDETLVSSDAVRRWIAGSKIATVGVPLAEVDLAGIEQAILRNGFVERANAYVTYDGELRVEVSQRRPLLRLLVDGYDCYVTADGFVFPAPRSASAYVPVVTGSYAPPAWRITSPRAWPNPRRALWRCSTKKCRFSSRTKRSRIRCAACAACVSRRDFSRVTTTSTSAWRPSVRARPI